MINNMQPMLKYSWLNLRHKWYVFQAGRRTGVSTWRLLVHDLSKFGPRELPHYGRQFFGDQSDPMGFLMAWLHHQNTNDHHWEYWVPRTGHDRGGLSDLRYHIRSMGELGDSMWLYDTWSRKKIGGEISDAPYLNNDTHLRALRDYLQQTPPPLPMPTRVVRELVADWMGATRAYTGRFPRSLEDWPWLQKNLGLVCERVHPRTRIRVLQVLDEVFPDNTTTKEYQ